MQLFFSPTLSSDSNSFAFDREESRHIVKVLRKKEGDKLHITNGKGDLFEAEIRLATDHKCEVAITSVTHHPSRDYKLHLAVAPTKMNDRYEWFLEKATEMGIAEITPLICDHSERKVVKTDRFDKIILSAMKQSLQFHLPKLNEPIAFKEFVKQERNGQLFIAHCEETEKQSLKSKLETGKDVTILIGPEGDFSTKEITMALENAFVPVSLGDTRLRTETAAIAACHSVVFANE